MCIYCNTNTTHQECKQDLFKVNKYFKWYCDIITNAKKRQDDSKTYYEKHHIIPKSMGGSNKKYNIVKLYPREHFLVHWIIIKCLVDDNHIHKMKYSLHRMMGAAKKVKKHVWSKWNFVVAKRHLVEVNKVIHIGEGNPMYGRKHSQDAKNKISIGNSGSKRSLEHKLKISEGNKKKVLSNETKDKIRNARLGTVFSEETIRRMKESGANTLKFPCPHCGIITTPGNIKRWHADNCKSLLN